MRCVAPNHFAFITRCSEHTAGIARARPGPLPVAAAAAAEGRCLTPPPHSSMQLALAASISGVIGACLNGEFVVDDAHTATCGLSMHGSSVCTAAYVGTAVSILLSVVMMALQVGCFYLSACN